MGMILTTAAWEFSGKENSTIDKKNLNLPVYRWVGASARLDPTWT